MEIHLHLSNAPLDGDKSKDLRSLVYLNEELFGIFGEDAHILAISASDDEKPLAYARIQKISALPPQLQDLEDTIDEMPMVFGSYGLAIALEKSLGCIEKKIGDQGSVICKLFLRKETMQPPPANCIEIQMPHIHEEPQAQKIIRAMERIAPQLLCGTLAWSDRAIPISWRNMDEIAYVAPSTSFSWISTETKIVISTKITPKTCIQPVDAIVQSISTQIASEMAGKFEVIQQLVSIIIHGLYSPLDGPIPLSRGMVLSGLPGIGKSHFLHLFQKFASGVHVSTLSAPDLFQTQVGQSEAKVLQAFSNARLQVPTLLAIEDIDAVAAKSTVALERSIFGVLLAALDREHEDKNSRIFVLATTNRYETLDPAIRSHTRLSHHIELRPPTQGDRLAMLRMMCHQVQTTPSLLEYASSRTTGFVGADLLNLVREAVLYSCNQGTPGDVSQLEAWDHALGIVQPSMLQHHKHDMPVKSTSEPLLFGMEEAMATLDVSLFQPLKDSSAYRQMGVLPPRGILITGESGVGKSQLLAAIAHKAGQHATCIPVRCTDLVSKVVGGTEKSLAALFATARTAAPCILLFDQIESLAPVRGFDTSTEHTFDRVLSLLLLEMDGFTSSTSPSDMRKWTQAQFIQQHVVLVATTTNSKQLDPSVLRPGRFDIEIVLAMPNEASRQAALRHLCSTTPIDLQDSTFSSVEEFVQFVAHRTKGLTIGQLNAVFQEAAMSSLRKSIDVDRLSVHAITKTLETMMGISHEHVEDVLSEEFQQKL